VAIFLSDGYHKLSRRAVRRGRLQRRVGGYRDSWKSRSTCRRPPRLYADRFLTVCSRQVGDSPIGKCPAGISISTALLCASRFLPISSRKIGDSPLRGFPAGISISTALLCVGRFLPVAPAKSGTLRFASFAPGFPFPPKFALAGNCYCRPQHEVDLLNDALQNVISET
jgi:hypothetical protein